MTALTGSLATASVSGLLQLLSTEGRTGRLDLEGPAVSGAAWLSRGDIVHAIARLGEKTASGEAALDGLLGLEQGRFAFTDGDGSPALTLSGTADQVLLEAACRRDHARRVQGPLADASVPSLAAVSEGAMTPRFNTLQWRLLASIDGRKDVASLTAELRLPRAAMEALLTELVAAGVVTLR